MAVETTDASGGASKFTDDFADATESSRSYGDGNSDSDVLDHVETPLNACSLESFCHKASVTAFGKQSSGVIASENSLIPLCLGCYQLNESTGIREGQLDLYAVPIHHNSDVEEKSSFSTENFGTKFYPPLTIFGDGDGSPGVLDGKWSNELPSSLPSSRGCGFHNYYATAHANGEIWIHEVSENEAFDGMEETMYEPPPEGNYPLHPFRATLVGKSISPSSNEGLCLAIAWENPLFCDSNENCTRGDTFGTRIISSYSDGQSAIHRVKLVENTDENNDSTIPHQQLELDLEYHWDSHKMFTCPAEVWCANFVDSNTVVTGGDEGSWKVWDLRQSLTQKPVYHGKGDFGAGVTVLSPHPRRENLLAVGSYDETIALFDLRMIASPTSVTDTNPRPETLYHSDSLGGGIWRCKWHPFEDHKLLVAAMHGGCVVGEFSGLHQTKEPIDSLWNVKFEIRKQFEMHQSMAYGIDWLVCSSSTPERRVEVAASCSFYDKAMYMWKTS